MNSDTEHTWANDLLAEYLVGRLAPEERLRLETHVKSCEGCTSEIHELRKYDLSVDEAGETEESPPPFKTRVIRSFQRLPRAVVRTLLVGAIVVSLGIVGFVVAEIDERSPDRLVALDSGDAVVIAHPPALESQGAERPRDVFERKGIPKDDQVAQPSDEPVIFFPEAKGSDHNESADNEDAHQLKGSSTDFLSYIKGEASGFRGRQPGKNPGVYDTLGVRVGGGGAGGRYGGRSGGHKDFVARGSASTVAKPSPTSLRPTWETGGAAQTSGGVAEPGGAPLPLQSPHVQREDRPGSQDESPRQSRKIIRQGELEFEIDSFDSAVATVAKIATEEQGFIATVNSEKLQNGKVRGSVVVRVPPDHLDTLLLKLRALGELKSQKIGSEDVTKAYTDLESRLRAARTMEERLLRIIRDGKGEIKDLLQAEKELGEWRTRIETMVGEINYYNNLIAQSTLTLTLSEREFRAPFGLIETERVEMGLEVEDVEKAHRDAISTVAELKGRITRSDLKQLSAGQFNAVLQFETAQEREGVARDRLKQLGTLARLEITRSQEVQGGTGKPQDLKVQQNDTQFLVSIYNLANVVPRETIHLNLACLDAEKSHKLILDRVEKASGRLISSRLMRPKGDQTTGLLQFQIKAAEADAVLQDIRAAGEVMKLEVAADSDTANSTSSKRGFDVNLFGLWTVQPRETTTVVLATKDVSAGYRLLLAAAKAADGHILTAQLNENDRKNMTANLSFELLREREAMVAEAMAKVGDVYIRNAARAQDQDNVVDSKVLLQLRLFDSANVPARETLKLSIEVDDVEGVAQGLEAEFKGRIVDARHARESSGQRESVLTIDVPLKNMPAAIGRIKSLGTIQEQTGTKNANIPDNDLAVGRLEVRISNEVLVGRSAGPWASMKRGLALSLQAGSWSLMLIMIGICFVVPLILVVWAAVKLYRRVRPKPMAGASAT